MKKFFFAVFFIFFSCFTSFNLANSEIINLQNEEKKFNDWKVFCEIDAMMNIAYCKLASKFYDSSSVLTIQPSTKFVNQLFLIIPQIKIGSFVKVRVDQNDLILSRNVNDKDFGLIPLEDQQKNTLFSQMKNGDFLFLRFNVRDSEKEITIKLNLKAMKDLYFLCVYIYISKL